MGCEQPDWLPVGWKIKVEVRSTGKKDKYFANPSKGLKLRSMPELFRYLKTSGKESKDRKPSGLRKVNPSIELKPKGLRKVAPRKSVAKQLPPGWIKEIRSTKKGNKIRRDSYYIDPVSGRRLRSMLEVYRYIESNDSGEATSKPHDKVHFTLEMGDHSKSVRRLVSSGEAKGKRSIGSKVDKHLTRNQRVKSGAMFVGLTKVDTRREKGGDFVAGNLPNMSTRVDAKEQVNGGLRRSMRSTGSKSKQKFTVTEASDDGTSKVSAALTDESKVTTTKNIIRDGTSNEPLIDDTNGKISNDCKNPANNLKQHKNPPVLYKRRYPKGRRACDLPSTTTTKNVGKDRLSDEPLVDDSDTNGKISNDFEDPANNQEQHKSLACLYKRKNPDPKCPDYSPGRTSKRLAQVEIEDPSLEIKMSSKSGVSATLSDESEFTTSRNFVKDGPLIDDTNRKISENPANNQKQHRSPPVIYKRKNPNSKCPGDLHDRASKRVARVEIEHPSLEVKMGNKSEVSATLSDESEVTTNGKISSGSSENPANEQDKLTGHDCKDGKESKKLDSPLDDLLMDPCIEFAFRTLVGKSPTEEVNKVGDSTPTPMLPSAHIWADPCFEFAVKMLTGEMPTEDSSRFHISVQQPLENVNPSNGSFSQFDAIKKPCLSQQVVKDPSFAHAASGGSQKFIGTRSGI